MLWPILTKLGQDDHWVVPHMSYDFDLYLTFDLDTEVKIRFRYKMLLLLQITSDYVMHLSCDLTLVGA